jgi:phosphatidylglycerophosphate synthase
MLSLENFLYYTEKGKWEPGEVPYKNDVIIHRVRKSFKDIYWYYANVIDYFRIVMGVIAIVLILHKSEWQYTIAVLIMGSVLLDWVDGPVARKYGQSTVMGCGWDWLGDLMAQYSLAIWCMKIESSATTFVVLFTIVEMTAGLFDFAVSAQSVYPSQRTDHIHWFYIVEHWLTPGGTYNNLGIACWLINTIYPIACCLHADKILCYSLIPFALLYAWHEVCQACFIIENWRETTAAFTGGLSFMRKCVESEKNVLNSMYDKCKTIYNIPYQNEREIYWVNIFYNGKMHPEFLKDTIRIQTETFVNSLVKEMFNEKRIILAYGFIIAPRNGNKDQRWHHDYGLDVSNLFIPMSRITQKNATQYVRHPLGAGHGLHPDSDMYYCEPSDMLNNLNLDYVEVNQMISLPYSIIKMYPGTIHRGISNNEDFDRLLFFICTGIKDTDLGESFGKQDEYLDHGDKR